MVLALAAGPQVAEGSQGPSEAQAPSTSKPVVALLGAVAATVDQVAGQEVVAAPSTTGSTSTPSPVESVVSATTGQSAAPDTVDLPRDTSAGSTGSPPRRSTPDVATTLRRVTQPVRQVTGGTLHKAVESVGGLVARVPAVAQSARRTVGGVATVAGELLEKTALEPVASRIPGLPQASTGLTPLGLLGGSLDTTSVSGVSRLVADSFSAATIASPDETPACMSCVADAPAALVGSNVPPARTATSASEPISAAVAPLGPSPSRPSPSRHLAAGSTRAGSSAARIPSTPRSPAPGGVASSAGGAAACAGLTLALLWLLATALPGVKRRLGECPQVRLIAPFELILQRPG